MYFHRNFFCKEHFYLPGKQVEFKNVIECKELLDHDLIYQRSYDQAFRPKQEYRLTHHYYVVISIAIDKPTWYRPGLSALALPN